jgi:hypothetical protein
MLPSIIAYQNECSGKASSHDKTRIKRKEGNEKGGNITPPH